MTDQDYTYIDPDAVAEGAEDWGVEEITDAEYADLMQNIEFEVQEVLEKEGIIIRED